MTDRAVGRLTGISANLAAAAFGFAGAWLMGLGLSVSTVLVSVLAGTFGWFLGWFGARALGRFLTRQGYAPAGLPVYRLGSLPADEVTAGGKARSLSALTRFGQRVPAGLAVLPRGFDGDLLTPRAAALLHRELARFPAGVRFAVRSSAAAEDSSTASFAGAYETVLDVEADQVVGAIAQVRASAGSGRVSSYAEATGTRAGDLAVVVQTMVPAELAGVLFTVHPLTADLATMLGTVVTGPGESVVSGEQTGEEFSFARPSGQYTGPAALRQYAAVLHAEAHRIEGSFGGVPQDIEWAVAGGKVWILQARPITTLNPWTPDTAERNDSLAGNALWSATNLSEANPEAQTPLTVSLVRFQQANGGPTMALRGREMAGHIGGRPYANLSVQITSRRGKAGKADPREVYRGLADWWGDLPAEVPIPLVPMTGEDWTQVGIPLLGSLVRMGWTRLRLPGFLAAHEPRCARLSATIAATTRPAELGRLWEDELMGFGIDSFWAVIASGSTYPATLEARLRQRYGTEDAAALMSNLSGLTGGLESLGPATGLREVRAGRMRPEDYLARFGHRGVNEIELAWPRPAEDPDWLGRALDGVDDPTPVAELRRRQQHAYDAALERLRVADPRSVRQLERQLLRAARHASLREAVRSEGARTTGVIRRFALRAGDLLGIGDDVFLLTIDELLAALAGDTTTFDHFEARRETYRRYRALPALPGMIVGRFDPFVWAADPDRRVDLFVAGAETGPRTAEHSGDIVGHPGASGRFEGVVRRLDRLEDSGQLRPGEILVTQLTNIGWTPLFPRAGAIITDLGAPLSHAAIVARELGIPAVVGCGDATTRLRTGDRVVVDGAAGRVTLLARPEADQPEVTASQHR